MKLSRKPTVIPPIPAPGTNPGVCPEYSSSVFSRLTFAWVQPLMTLGSKRPLEKEDIWELTEQRRASYIATRFREFWAKEVAKHKESVIEAERIEVEELATSTSASSGKLAKTKKPKIYRAKLWKAINNTFLWQFWSAAVLKVIGDSLQVHTHAHPRSLDEREDVCSTYLDKPPFFVHCASVFEHFS